MRKLKRIVVIAALSGLTGCSTTYDAYNVSMPSSQSGALVYLSDGIDISFSIQRDGGLGTYPGTVMEHYENIAGISFVLMNKTDKTLTIDWNKVSFKDTAGFDGNAVMHKGVKYNECASFKAPSVVPPKGRLMDVITPCYAVEFASSQYGSTWVTDMLPAPRNRPETEFGLFMPIRVGDAEEHIKVSFKATKTTKKW
jgi:hypothetical protein